MQSITIADKRRFSLESVQQVDVVKTDDLHIQLLCFEAGQTLGAVRHAADCAYQVREGELLIRVDGEKLRVGKGKLLMTPGGKEHSLENAGGGLLVVLATHLA